MDGIMWREIPSLPGYRVSSDGQVQSRWMKVSFGRRGTVTTLGSQWKDRKAQTLPNGYKCIGLQSGTNPTGKRATAYIHRMVAEAFIGPCPPGMEVCHGDGDRGNNTVANLRYGTRTENMADTLRHGTRPVGVRHGIAKLNDEKVRAIRTLIATKEPMQSIGSRFGVSATTILHIKQGSIWRHVS